MFIMKPSEILAKNLTKVLSRGLARSFHNAFKSAVEKQNANTDGDK
jgi:hypothetical protein